MVKNLPANGGDTGDRSSISELEKSPGAGNGKVKVKVTQSSLTFCNHSPCQDTEMGSCSLLQGIFPTQGSNPGLLHCRWILYRLSRQGSHVVHFTVHKLDLNKRECSMDVRIVCKAVWEPIKHGFIFLQQNKYRTFLRQITIFPDTSSTSLLVAFSQPWGKFSQQLTRQ